jgi:AcrR family transcriptional regulator
MDKRRYVQRARAASAEATRKRVLAAARRSLERGPLGALKVDEVAREAGVSRSTVYVLYGSRGGLFDALGRHLRDEAGFDQLVAAFRQPDALDAMRDAQRAAVRMYALMPELARGLFTLAAIDPDGVAAVAAIEDGRRPGMVDLAGRLAAQGYLREGVSVEEASQILTVISSFQSFDELFGGLGLPPDTVADRLIAMTERSILRPDLPSEAERAQRPVVSPGPSSRPARAPRARRSPSSRR